MKLLFTGGVLLLCLSPTLHAQSVLLSPEVIASAGGRASNATLVLDWNMGELAVASLSTSPTFMLTEGFEQANRKENVAISPQLMDENLLTLYPNPATTHFVLHSENPDWLPETATLIDAKGSEVMRIPITRNDMEVSIESLADATYFLTVISTTHYFTRTFKIIKTH